jgi:hypothetical protein
LLPISQQLQPLHSFLIQPLPCILKDRAIEHRLRSLKPHGLFTATLYFLIGVFNVLLKIPPGFLVSKFLNKPFDVKTGALRVC